MITIPPPFEPFSPGLLDLPACRSLATGHLAQPARERVLLQDARGRVSAMNLAARLPVPGFRQSLRDGYALATPEGEAPAPGQYPVVALVRAGDTSPPELAPGTACRITTGALVPAGARVVVPQEECTLREGYIHLTHQRFRQHHSYIEECGSEVAVGQSLAPAGTILLPEHLAMLASTGWQEIEVFRRPRVAFFCTGSELVNDPAALAPGLKISSNHQLLAGLIRRYGADPLFMGRVDDSRDALATTFTRLAELDCNMVISTGGVGPGKYDLLEEAFVAAGGRLLYTRLALIPGKGSLGGLLDDGLFFGLPGPPTAVHALLSCLVGPLLLQAQGVRHPFPRTIMAELEEPINIRSAGVMQLRGVNLSIAEGHCLARVAGKLDIPDGYLLISARTAGLEPGQLGEVLLLDSPYGLAAS